MSKVIDTRGNTMSPTCPNCGSSMVKRIAKKGPNAGNEFYGCVNFPHCRGTRSIEKAEKPNDTPAEKIHTVSADKATNRITYEVNSDLVINYVAKPYFGFDAMEAFQSIGCSKEIIDCVSTEDGFERTMLGLSKFRVDYTKTLGFELSAQQRDICALVLRTLCRGRITYVSPYVEENISRLFEANEKYSESSALNSINVFRKKVPYSYDSLREQSFSKDVLKRIFGDNWQYYVDTQVFVDSLCGERGSSEEQRVDFLVSSVDKEFIIELDGVEHIQHNQKDEKRDHALAKSGYKILRRDNSIVDYAIEELYHDISRELSFVPSNYNSTKANSDVVLIAIYKLIHQIQIAIVSGLLRGIINPAEQLSLNVDSEVLSNNDINNIGTIIFDDLKQQFDAICALYQVPRFFDCKYDYNEKNCISYQTSIANGRLIKVMVSSINSIGRIANPVPYYNDLEIEYYDEELLEYYLKYFFRHDEFREGQFEGITRLLSGQDSIILLPTGSGKSVIYQLAAMLQPGKTIVVSPLVSLMQDQIENLKQCGIECAVAVHSNNRDVYDIINDSSNVMIYISPERLQLKSFRDSLNSMQVNSKVCAVAIDEAHCVSEWGHDFRTAYLNIGRTTRSIFDFYGKTPTIIALTGTASTAVLKDVKRELEIMDYDSVITPKTFDRPELSFKVVYSSSDNKERTLQALLTGTIPQFFNTNKAEFYRSNGTKTRGGIVFCPHVNGNFGVVSVSDAVKKLGISTDIYSGRAPKGYFGNWDVDKATTAKYFKQNKISTLVATKAFGMGIDKPNVAFTVHYGIPGSIESFYQEAGRAARGKNQKALCTIVLSDENNREDEVFFKPETNLSKIDRMIKDKIQAEQDDISRMLYFHTQSFKGIDFEYNLVNDIAEQLYSEEGELSSKSVILTIEENTDKTLSSVQKAIQRLLVLGVIKDYTVDYSANEITVYPGSDDDAEIRDKYATYVRGYNEGRVAKELKNLDVNTDTRKEFVLNAAKVLTNFIYDTVEKGRRRGLQEMHKATRAALKSSDPDATLRERVVRYFETTYADKLFEVVEDKNLGFPIIKIIIDGEAVDNESSTIGGIRAANEAAGLRGGTSRFLESTPDHPGLLILRALAELYCKDYNKDSIINDIRSACIFATERYSQTADELSDILNYFICKVLERDEGLYEPVLDALTEYVDENEVNGAIIENQRLPDRVKLVPAKKYFSRIGQSVVNLISERKGV